MRDSVDDTVDLQDETAGAGRGRRGAAIVVAAALLRRPRDTLAGAAGMAAFATIVINALFMQPGPHPAPIFALRTEHPPVVVAGRESTGALSVLPRPRPADAPIASRTDPQPTAAATAKPVAPRALVTDIQRELLRRGYYDGPINGVLGSRTEAAIRDFEQATGIAPAGEATDAVLKSIARAPVKAKPGTPPRRDPIAGLLSAAPAPAPHPSVPVVQAKATVSSATVGSAPVMPVSAPAPLPVVQAKAMAAPPTPPASVPVPSTGPSQIKSVQRALADYGYGQVRPTGVYDKTTHDAIAAFEEARRMPVTGQVSDKLVRELVALTGRPIE